MPSPSRPSCASWSASKSRASEAVPLAGSTATGNPPPPRNRAILQEQEHDQDEIDVLEVGRGDEVGRFTMGGG
jgi:hypothetical protein